MARGPGRAHGQGHDVCTQRKLVCVVCGLGRRGRDADLERLRAEGRRVGGAIRLLAWRSGAVMSVITGALAWRSGASHISDHWRVMDAAPRVCRHTLDIM